MLSHRMNFSSYIKMDYEQVRKIQEAAEAAGSDFWETAETDPNFDYDDWVVKHAESSLLVSNASDNHELHHNEDFHLQ